MEQSQILEGTWEDIKQHEQELSGRWLKVFVEGKKEQSDPAPQTIRQEAAANSQTSTKALSGRGLFRGKMGGTEALLRQKRADLEREEQRF